MSAELPAGYRLPQDLATAVRTALERAAAEHWVPRIWQKDAALWSDNPAEQARIVARLGWLHGPEEFLDHPEELAAFAASVREEGSQATVLLGMGGSSLAPQVLRDTFGVAEGGLPLHVLDSTDPAAVARVLDAWDPARTLYLVSTKSGSTIETLSFLAFFWDAVRRRGGQPGRHFAAITDPGKSLEAIPHADDFRSVFLNPPDVGGRYSALTYVGLVPGALLGLDLAEILARGVDMAQSCREEGVENPGLVLGLTLGTLARAGRDKLTLWCDPSIASLGAWIEQLIAESTGKEGTGIVPVDREPLGDPTRYGMDRLFVRLACRDCSDPSAPAWRRATDQLAEKLIRSGHPVIDLEIPTREALGAEFFRWEFATAVAGAGLGINPFDEPNVAESKHNTEAALDEYRARHAWPVRQILGAQGPLAAIGPRLEPAAVAGKTTAGQTAAFSTYSSGTADGAVVTELRRHLERLAPAGYVSLQAYVAPTPERDAALARMRALIRDHTGRATTAGYGPRFLHSTGQLHKGGRPSGWFLQLTAGHPQDLEIHGAGYTFGALIDAQAEGDLAALEAHRLPVLRIRLSDDPDAGLAALTKALEKALESASPPAPPDGAG